MLAQIEKSVPLGFNLEKSRWEEYNKERVAKILKDLEFFSLIDRMPNPGNKKEGVEKTLTLW